MPSWKKKLTAGVAIFVGIDLHKRRWHVTIRSKEVELCSISIPGSWVSLRRILDRYKGHKILCSLASGEFV